MKQLPCVFLRCLPVLAVFLSGAAMGGEVRAQPAPVPLQLLAPEQELDLALRAAPEHLRAEATTYLFGAGGYALAHQGSNGMNCLVNRDGQQNGDAAFRPTCWDAEGSASILPVVLRVGELLAQGMPGALIKHDIDAAYSAGRFRSPRKLGIAYMLLGDLAYDAKSKTVRTLFPGHYMVYAPGVNNADIGFNAASSKAAQPLPFIYDGYSGGTHSAYLIVLAAQVRPASR